LAARTARSRQKQKVKRSKRGRSLEFSKKVNEMGLLEGKKAAIFGVANDRSIAWAIAEAFHGEGAELAFTFAGEMLEKRVRPLAEGIGARIILPCDVTKDEDVEKVFATLKQEWGGLDILIHAIAFANKEDLANPYVQTSRAGFQLAMDVSAYSLVALTRHAAALMEGRNGAVLTLTYMGSEKVIPNYNVMGVAKAALEASVRYLAHDLGPKGIRVNAISAGPLRTLAAAGISDFKSMLHHVAERAPLKRNIDAEEVGKTALYLCSDWGSAVTGEVMHVDAGYNIMGM
jgi:enoyl-[acyl-carrier protein] reductase I